MDNDNGSTPPLFPDDPEGTFSDGAKMRFHEQHQSKLPRNMFRPDRVLLAKMQL